NIGGMVVAHADRPVRVDGQRLPFKGAGQLIIIENADGTFLLTGGIAVINTDLFIGIALENAIARVLAPDRLALFAALDGTRVDRGALLFLFRLQQLLPILPDPYVPNFETPIVTEGVLTAESDWETPADPHWGLSTQRG